MGKGGLEKMEWRGGGIRAIGGGKLAQVEGWVLPHCMKPDRK